MSGLAVERKGQTDETFAASAGEGGERVTVLMTPPITEDYWAYRVVVADGQAVIGFPKFFTIGVGFAVEDDDWNRNLPYTSDAEAICDHIWRNRGPALDGDDARARVIEAIALIQAAVREDRDETRERGECS